MIFLLILFFYPLTALEILREDFIFDQAPSCHASTIVQIGPETFYSACFAGSKEGAQDIKIYGISFDKNWKIPEVIASREGVPAWNPVLFRYPDGEMLLFYKMGENPRSWSGWIKRSLDDGKTWGSEERLPGGILGPIKNKPLLHNNTLVCGSSVESYLSDAVWIELTKDRGRTWEKRGPIYFSNSTYGLIQPALYFDNLGHLHIFARPRKGLKAICRTRTDDLGSSWDPISITDLPNPDTGFDLVKLRNGAIVLVNNPTVKKRSRLELFLSKDGSKFDSIWVLEEGDGEYSYPALIEDAFNPGIVHITYTWNRTKIKYLKIDLNERNNS